MLYLDGIVFVGTETEFNHLMIYPFLWGKEGNGFFASTTSFWIV
jgi:hypothetical protein